jgi:hypothetical protein
MRIRAKDYNGDWNKALDHLISTVEHKRVLTNKLLLAQQDNWEKIVFVELLNGIPNEAALEAVEMANLLLHASEEAKEKYGRQH